MNLADDNPDSYRGIIQEAGITITPCSRDRWFPATCANFSSFKEHPGGHGKLITLQQTAILPALWDYI